MIRTLKKTISDVTFSDLKSDPIVVKQIITDLTDQSKTNIFLYADNNAYISKLLHSMMDFISLFEALNTVNDEILNRVPLSMSGPEQDLAPILMDYGNMLYRYQHFYSWLKNCVLLMTESEILLTKQFTLDEIKAIKQIIKDQSKLLADKLDSKHTEIADFIKTHKNKRTYGNVIRQMNRLNEYISELHRYCVRNVDMAS